MATTMAIAAPITIAVGVVMAVRQDVGLSAILVVAIPAAAIVLGVIVARMVPTFQLMQERIDQINRVLREQITGIRVVRAFVREPEETARFEGDNAELTAVALRSGRLMSSMFPVVNLLINLSSVAVIWIGADRIAAGDIEVGSMIAFLSYMVQILLVGGHGDVHGLDDPAGVRGGGADPGGARHGAVGRRRRRSDRQPTDEGTAGAARASGSTTPAPSTPCSTTSASPPRPAPRQPSSAAPAPARRRSSTSSPACSTPRRAASSSTGSTCASSILRCSRPCIGLVPQRPYLFSGTVASNLHYGKPDATEEEMWEALAHRPGRGLRAGHAGGLDARIEQGGTNVSGGQRQRLSIARALVRRPEIYVFDDSFSALDLATDARLRAALAPHTRDAAVVIVAQRVSTISTADQIIVLDDGEIVGIGTHEELLASNPTYAEIVESQIGEGKAA